MAKSTLTMTMAKALVYRNRVVEKIRKAQTQVMSVNGCWDYETFKGDIRAELENLTKLQTHLVAVKTAIMLANSVDMGDGECAQAKIFRLAELKGRLVTLGGIQCETRKQRNSDGTGTFIEFKVQLNEKERDAMVEVLTGEIDALQDSLNAWNNTHKITVMTL